MIKNSCFSKWLIFILEASNFWSNFKLKHTRASFGMPELSSSKLNVQLIKQPNKRAHVSDINLRHFIFYILTAFKILIIYCLTHFNFKIDTAIKSIFQRNHSLAFCWPRDDITSLLFSLLRALIFSNG